MTTKTDERPKHVTPLPAEALNWLRHQLGEDRRVAVLARSFWNELAEDSALQGHEPRHLLYEPLASDEAYERVEDHIVHHGPKQVIADIDAKLEILVAWQEMTSPEPTTPWALGFRAGIGYALASVLRAYRRRPGYQSDWIMYAWAGR